MGGAFVAVADDATATYWNPAGLGSGGTFSVLLDRSTLDAIPDPDRPVNAATRATSGSGGLFALSTPAVGLTYYRVRSTNLRPQPEPKVEAAGDRQPTRSGEVGVDSLTVHHFGVTVVQTLVEGLTVGTTVKFVRGVSASGSVQAEGTVTGVLDEADGLDGEASKTADLDLGVMAVIGSGRVGLVVRNLTEPEFSGPSGSESVLKLERQARLGVAWTPGRPGSAPGAPLTIAFDVDLTRTPTPLGDRRNVAAGIERWFTRRVGIRGGLRTNTLDTDLVSASAGASVAVRSGTFVEGQVTRGRTGADRSWSVATRLGF